MGHSNPKQIFYVWNYKEWGGAQIYFLGLIKEAKKTSEIIVMLPRESDDQLLKFLDQPDVKIEFLQISSDIGEAKSLLRKVRRHWRKLRSEIEVVVCLSKHDLKDSVVHIEFAPWQSLLSLLYLCMKTNVFVTMHNSLPPVSKFRYYIWKIKFALITNFKGFSMFPSNEDAKKSLKPLVSDAFFKKTVITYTNVNPDEIEFALESVNDSSQLKKRFGIPAEKVLVFCVGQFVDRKGRWTFLQAAQQILKSQKDIAFVWISNSKRSNEDIERILTYGLGENFVFITSDQVGSEHLDLFKLLRLADIFALVSFQEGLPISLLEAMALGIPSISTNVNAIPEAVKHLETGWLIEAGDSDHLVRAIEKLKADSDLRSKLALNGREYVLANFNEKVVAQIALKGYRDSLS